MITLTIEVEEDKLGAIETKVWMKENDNKTNLEKEFVKRTMELFQTSPKYGKRQNLLGNNN